MLSSGHDAADAHLSSQQPWSPAQDQANQDFGVDRKRQLWCYWELMAAEKEKALFLGDMTTVRLPIPQWTAPYPCPSEKD